MPRTVSRFSSENCNPLWSITKQQVVFALCASIFLTGCPGIFQAVYVCVRRPVVTADGCKCKKSGAGIIQGRIHVHHQVSGMCLFSNITLELWLQSRHKKKHRICFDPQWTPKLPSFFRCRNCAKTSERSSEFYELDLNIKGHSDIHQCIGEFLEVGSFTFAWSWLRVAEIDSWWVFCSERVSCYFPWN